MPLTAQGYFNCLHSYLNLNHYGEPTGDPGEVVLKEKVYQQSGSKPKEYRVTLKTSGEVIVFKLDRQKNGSSLPLFHFLDDNAKPWSKRCDFVVFNRRKNQLFAYCFEFKSESIPHDAHTQLKASLDWVKALHATINAYTGEKLSLRLTKFILTEMQNAATFLDAEGKYLSRDHTVRHYLYSEINGMELEDLDNTNVEMIR
jgi:hypothetical protein